MVCTICMVFWRAIGTAHAACLCKWALDVLWWRGNLLNFLRVAEGMSSWYIVLHAAVSSHAVICPAGPGSQ